MQQTQPTRFVVVVYCSNCHHSLYSSELHVKVDHCHCSKLRRLMTQSSHFVGCIFVVPPFVIEHLLVSEGEFETTAACFHCFRKSAGIIEIGDISYKYFFAMHWSCSFCVFCEFLFILLFSILHPVISLEELSIVGNHNYWKSHFNY